MEDSTGPQKATFLFLLWLIGSIMILFWGGESTIVENITGAIYFTVGYFGSHLLR